jgi:hypothetical protein
MGKHFSRSQLPDSVQKFVHCSPYKADGGEEKRKLFRSDNAFGSSSPVAPRQLSPVLSGGWSDWICGPPIFST